MEDKQCEYCKNWFTPKKDSVRFCSKRCSAFARELALSPEITIDGVTKKQIEWIKESGISSGLFHNRVNAGWEIENALTTPLCHQDQFSKDPRYPVWHAMLGRCRNPNNHAYSRYGGRGITVCLRWTGKDGFKHFCADMGERPEKTSIDRIDNEKGYCKENCRWATVVEQANNTCKTKMLTIGGKTQSLSDWCKEYGINKSTVCSRLRCGYTEAEAILLPIHKRGESLSEDDVQIALCRYLDTKEIKYWHTPNETWTSSWATKARNKKKGVKAGVPDLTILLPSSLGIGFFTLYLELKTETGTMSDDQKEWQEVFDTVNACEFRCCHGLAEAVDLIDSFLDKVPITRKNPEDIF